MATPDRIPQIRRYQDWLARTASLEFDSYSALWQWSVDDLEAFWRSVWDYFALQSPTPFERVLAEPRMPGAHWFQGAQVNYAQQVLRHVAPAQAAGVPAIVTRDERGQHRETSWPELRRHVAALALHLQAQGVQPGDRVAAYLPNTSEAIVAFLAVASLGAVWSVCAPDMGTNAVLDRFRQIEPRVLIACDGVRYGGRDLSRLDAVATLRGALPTVQHLIVLRHLGSDLAPLGTCIDFAHATARDDDAVRAFSPRPLPFDHPLWIVYSSGTTGLPKPIVHGHGGTMIVSLLQLVLHNDIGCSYAEDSFGERYHWYSTTGWVVWNGQVGGLLSGTTCCLYDGSPAGTGAQPDWNTLWRFAADLGVTFFGAGAAFYTNCMKAGIDLASCGDLSRVRALGTTGSPLPEDVQRWGVAQFERLGVPGMWWCNVSGGTDFAGAFIGGNRELPQTPGRMQCRLLGCAVEAWSDAGQPVIGEVGELVCVKPIPSMPLYLWNDPDGERLRSSYFDVYPGVWRHGDWLEITEGGECVIYGRSDATINRHGLRMGTSEIYRAVEALPVVADAMVVDLEYLGRDSFMPLFVVLRPDVTLDDALRSRINDAIRQAVSPRFLPNEIVQAPEIPRTLTGKKQELPIKNLLLGQPLEKVVNRDAMANPRSLDWYVDYARHRAAP